MPELTPKLHRKSQKLLKVVKMGGDESDIELADQIFELEETLEENKAETDKKIDIATANFETKLKEATDDLPNLDKILDSIKGKDSKPEEVAEALASNADFIEKVTPKNGEDYVLTTEDKQEIAKIIDVPVVEKVIERTEVIREQPMVTNEIREVAVLDVPALPQYGEQFRDGLELLEGDERLDKKAVKGLEELEEEIAALRRSIANIPRGGGSRASHAMKLKPLTADGVTKIFSVPKNVTGWVQGSDFPSTLYEGSGLTFNATRTQLTLGVDNAPSNGSQLLFIYSEVFNS